MSPDPTSDTVRARFEAFSRLATLELFLPRSSDLDATSATRVGSPDNLLSAPTRRNLFFDEHIKVVILLKTSVPQNDVRSILSSVQLTLAAHVTDAAPQVNGTTPSATGKHDLGSEVVPGESFTEVLWSDDKCYVIFELALHLARPHVRLQRPAIYFTANLSLRPDVLRDRGVREKDYLQSFEPIPANVLEPLQFDPALRGSNIFLPENRITKVAPKRSAEPSAIKPIRGATKRAFPAIPALFTRVKYFSTADAVIASVALETSSLIAGSVSISSAALSAPGINVEPLTDLKWPVETSAGDETGMLFKMTPPTAQQADESTQPIPVTVTIKANAALDQGSRVELDINWQSLVDMSMATPRLVYRWSTRPTSTSLGAVGHSEESTSAPSSLEGPQKGPKQESGIIFFFTAPETVQTNDEFRLGVQCTNKSGRDRRFALDMIRPSKPTPASQGQTASVNVDLVDHVFNNALPLELSKQPSFLELNPGLRIDPLPLGAICETHMAFRALERGVLDLGTLRVTDLDTGQTIAVNELPHVIAVQRSGEEVLLNS